MPVTVSLFDLEWKEKRENEILQDWDLRKKQNELTYKMRRDKFKNNNFFGRQYESHSKYPRKNESVDASYKVYRMQMS